MLRVKDIRDTRARLRRGTTPVLLCPACGSRYSADPGDYWAADPNEPLRCGHCYEAHPARVAPALVLARIRARVDVIAR